MILLIDNYDSFSYNLYQLMGNISPHIQVVRNDALTLEQIEELHPQAIVLSPGPGRPENSGNILEVVTHFAPTLPILGVCLGHQAICQAFGASITYAPQLMHGKTSQVAIHHHQPLFRGLGPEIQVGRYHSLVVDPTTLPSCLEVTASAPDGEIMAVQHKAYPVYGVQFHPESILTPQGSLILENFITQF